MSSRFLASMKYKLARLHIYDPEAPGISAELGAYEAGIAPLEERAEKVFADFFLLTAGAETLRKKESLICAVSGMGDEARRDFLLNYGRKDKFAPGREAELLPMVGIIGTLTENYSGDPYKVGLRIDSLVGTTQDAAVERLRELMPLHLEIVLE